LVWQSYQEVGVKLIKFNMTTEYVTNTVVEHHNTWTLIEHVAGSINKAAAKTDATVYGTHTNVVVKEKPVEHPALEICGMIFAAIFMFIIFIGFMTGNVKGRDIIGI
jgi:hypothetical protein